MYQLFDWVQLLPPVYIWTNHSSAYIFELILLQFCPVLWLDEHKLWPISIEDTSEPRTLCSLSDISPRIGEWTELAYVNGHWDLGMCSRPLWVFLVHISTSPRWTMILLDFSSSMSVATSIGSTNRPNFRNFTSSPASAPNVCRLAERKEDG